MTRSNKMAEGGEVSGRREDLIKNCSPCNTKGTEKAATKYCFMCETHFCQDCTELHNSLLSNHRVTDIESATVGVPVTLHTEACPQHGKTLRLYCKEHDSMCCEECFDREHISCKEVAYLPLSAKEIVKNIDVEEIKANLKKTIEQLESIKINQQENVTSLEADREKCLNELDEHHTELQELLEKIVQSSKDQIEHTFKRFSADLQRHQQAVEKCLVDLKSSEKRVERNQGKDFPFFVELKKCQNQLKAIEEVSTKSLGNLKVRGFSVDMDERLHILLSDLDSLVTVLKHGPVQVKKKYQVNVSRKEDKQACCIFGSCILSEGSILLADNNNKMLKCLHRQSLKVQDQCQMQNGPIDVCVINNSEVAVTQQNKTIVIVSVRPRLTPTRTISMNHHCAYVAYSEGELFISDINKALYIYTMEGSLMREVTTNPSGQELFSRTRHVAVNAEGDKVYVADFGTGLTILERQGQVKDKMVIDKIRGTQGLCLDGAGDLFVCGNISNNVIYVQADGRILTEVLTSSDGLAMPRSLCYDKLRKRLIVTQHSNNNIHVCELD